MMTGLNILALALSLFLTWHYFAGGTIAGCGGGSPCEQVLSSRWSSLAGVLPVSGLAIGVYLALLIAGFFTGRDSEPSLRRLAWGIMLILAGSVAGSAIWFTFVQKWIIGAYCPYCMTAHITGMLLSALIIWQAIKAEYTRSENNNLFPERESVTGDKTDSNRMFPLYSIGGLVFAGLLLAGIVPVSQSVYKPPAVYDSGKSQENMPVTDFSHAPLVGSQDAAEKVIVMFDYQCSHCQQLHFMLDMVIERYGGKLAFILCPAPLNPKCNPYVPVESEAFRNSCELVRTGLAVWRAAPEAFPAFQNYMFTFESGDRWRPRKPEDARAKAVELVGNKKFDEALTDVWIDEYIQTCVRLYGRTLTDGKGGIPRLLYGSRWVIPDAINADELVMILRESLAVPLQP